MRASTIALLTAAAMVAVLFLSLEHFMLLVEANAAAHAPRCVVSAPCRR